MNSKLIPSFFALASCVTPVANQANATAAEPARKPNIILFLVDDMGWQDTSLPFWTQRTHWNNTFNTPNMERLASEGVMMTQAYASAISSPSRCSLFTGANASRHRVTNWTLRPTKTTDSEDKELAVPQWNFCGISQAPDIPHTFHATSLAQILKLNGYRTIHCGKAHLGAIDTPGEDPIHLGFEVNIAGHAAGGPASYLGETCYGNKPDAENQSVFATPGLREYWNTPTFLTEALTKEALKALDKSKKLSQPFFLYMSHYAIHVPINKDARFYQKYIDKGLSPKEAAYAALIEGMDHSLGDIMKWVDDNGERDNTVIIFMSDNGGLGAHAGWRDVPAHQTNTPLRSGKGSLYEGGIREPMIVRWPGVVTPNTRCDKSVLIEDFFPTLLEMAQIKEYQTVQTVDGVSFMPLLTGKGDPSKGRSLVWNFPNNWDAGGPGINFNCAIRKDNWKLLYDYRTGRKELYDIPNDISEANDVAAKYPKVVQALSKELGTLLRSRDAQRPTVKATGKPCPWPDEIK